METEYIIKIFETCDIESVNSLLDAEWVLLTYAPDNEGFIKYALGWDKRNGETPAKSKKQIEDEERAKSWNVGIVV